MYIYIYIHIHIYIYMYSVYTLALNCLLLHMPYVSCAIMACCVFHARARKLRPETIGRAALRRSASDKSIITGSI